MESYDVIVVGAGMVGMACAVGLAQKGYTVALLESRSEAASLAYDQRVVAISRASERLFESLGVWSAMVAHGVSPYSDMVVWDSEREGRIRFSASEWFESHLGHIVEQSVIVGALWQAIQRVGTIVSFFEINITALAYDDEWAIVQCADSVKRAKIVIGADGARSIIRTLSDVVSDEHDYQQIALVATLRGTKPHAQVAYQRFARTGPLAWLPLVDPYATSIVWSTSPMQASMLKALSPEAFGQAVTRESEGQLGVLSLQGERHTFSLRSHHAKHYVLPRMALIGDAAHTIHPLAGMGGNLGLLDVACLITLFAKGKQGQRDIGRLAFLKRYERQRRWHNGVMRQCMRLFKEGFGSCSPWVEWGRNQLLNYVDQRQRIKDFFVCSLE